MRVTGDCEFVRNCELGLEVEPRSQVAGDCMSKISPPTAKRGANAANSVHVDEFRSVANLCEMRITNPVYSSAFIMSGSSTCDELNV